MTNMITIHDRTELPLNIMWRVSVTSDGGVSIELTPTTVFGVAGALAAADALRAAAREIENAATETVVTLYGEGGNA